MKTKNTNIAVVSILFSLSCFSSASFAQPGWNIQPSGSPQNLRDVFLVDSALGIAVGDNGTILRTSNGGATWAAESSGTSRHLFSVSFANRDTGIAVGGHSAIDFSDATILRTIDGGIHWANLYGDSSSPFGYFLHDIKFLNRTLAIAVGGNPIFFGEIFGILRSTDAGATWQRVSFGETAALLACSFADSNNGMAVGTNRRIMKSTDGGATWSLVSSGGSTLRYDGVHYAPPFAIIVGDSGTILRTTDGGTSWNTHQDESGATLTGVEFPGPLIGYVVSANGGILKSTNQGNAWNVLESKTTRSLQSASFIDPEMGTAVGDSGTILHTTHGGDEVDLNVTIRVHMGVQIFKGSFRPDLGDLVTLHFKINGGDYPPDTLHDADGDSIYTTTLIFKSHQSIDYRFWKTLRDGIDSERIGSDRSLSLSESDATLPLVFFSNDSIYPTLVSYDAGWNMISLPRLVADRSKAALFPSSNSNLFAFDGSGYVPGDSLKKGIGYWIRFPSPGTASFSGPAIANDTIDVEGGWNLIGTITDTIAVESDIVSDPPGIVVSNFFAFISSTYSTVTALEPGRAYWVKVNQSGKLILESHSSVFRK